MGEIGYHTALVPNLVLAVNNRIGGGRAVMTSDANQYTRSITAYITNTIGMRNWRCALYDNTKPRNLVAQTEERLVNTGVSGWETFNFQDPTALIASQEYLMVTWATSGTGSQNLWAITNNTSIYWSEYTLIGGAYLYTGTFPSVFPAPIGSATVESYIYLTFSSGSNHIKQRYITGDNRKTSKWDINEMNKGTMKDNMWTNKEY